MPTGEFDFGELGVHADHTADPLPGAGADTVDLLAFGHFLVVGFHRVLHRHGFDKIGSDFDREGGIVRTFVHFAGDPLVHLLMGGQHTTFYLGYVPVPNFAIGGGVGCPYIMGPKYPHLCT